MDTEADPALKAIINQVIEEADHEKLKIKQAKVKTIDDDPATNGDQEEAVEGDVANDDPDVDPEGPIKEHLLSEVHKRRGQKRKERAFGDDKDSEKILDQLDAPSNTVRQQEAELPDDGPTITAFNMDEAEREEAGLGGSKKGEEEEDAWLLSLQEPIQDPNIASTSTGSGSRKEGVGAASSKMTDAARAQHEAQQKVLDSNDPLSDAEIASARSLLLQHLLPREKVMQALARLSSARSTSDPTIKARDRVGSKRVKQSKPVIIDALTDAATSLLTEDADAFELTREEIAHALQISQVTVPQTRPPGDSGNHSDGDEDMFADSDDEKKSAPESAAAPQGIATAATVSTPGSTSTAEPVVGAGPGAEKPEPALVQVAGVEGKAVVHCVNDEEGELGTVPLGFILDRVSGYYMHPESGWYYHLESRCYYRNGTWYSAGAVPTETA